MTINKTKKQGCVYLSEEIIANILSRLPAKFVGRCRCVCKLWYALLSQSHFIKAHLNRTKLLPQDFLISSMLTSLKITESISLSSAHHLFDKITVFGKALSDAYEPDDQAFVIASCYGLIFAITNQENSEQFLINPTTQEIRKVPSSPFVLDPNISNSVFGFGYDSVSDDYKVVKLSHYIRKMENEDDSFRMFVDVYSVKHGTWKRAARSSYYNTLNNDDISGDFFLHGRLHWLVMNSDLDYVIGAFDLTQEKFFEVPLPKFPDSEEYFEFSCLCVIGDSLCLYSSPETDGLWCRGTGTIKTDVWIMKEYGVESSWTKFTITNHEGIGYKPLCLWGQGQILLEEKTASYNLVMCNVEEQTLTDVVVHGVKNCDFSYTFMESIVSPYYSD